MVLVKYFVRKGIENSFLIINVSLGDLLILDKLLWDILRSLCNEIALVHALLH